MPPCALHRDGRGYRIARSQRRGPPRFPFIRQKVRIMVTMSSEAATDYELLLDLLRSGMDCMRINCAHDNSEAWLAMICNLQRAREETGRSCRILMDVAGPKLRTGPIEPGHSVIKCRPKRDVCGRVVAPACIWLTPNDDLRRLPAPPMRAFHSQPASSNNYASVTKSAFVLPAWSAAHTARLSCSGQKLLGRGEANHLFHARTRSLRHQTCKARCRSRPERPANTHR